MYCHAEDLPCRGPLRRVWGLTEGLRKTGRYDPVGAVEVDPAAAATYAENFGSKHIRPEGIAEWLDAGHAPEADVVVGGPPCQGFSNLGKRLDDDPATNFGESTGGHSL